MLSFIISRSFAHQVIFCVCFFFVVRGTPTVVEVDSPFGKIHGVKKTDEDTGHSYVSFKGIPYAKPPVGDLRFAKPQPHPKLENVFDGTKDDKIVCPHPDVMIHDNKKFTEDCLVLNILTKDIDSSKILKKVLVYIHGGGFLASTAYFYNTKSFVNSQDVIVVTINYRLGVLGFLSTENEASPGNYGLWDQTLALKWVKDNIRAFGGDPDDVTIAGESAGAASVGYLSLSPYTKGLFTKAYLQSGTGTSLFARLLDAQSDALVLANATGCWDKETDRAINLAESKSIIECLRKVPFSVFGSKLMVQISKTVFVPRVDNDFIPDVPLNLLHNDTHLDSIGFFDRSYLFGIGNNEAGFAHMYLSMVREAIFMNKASTQKQNELIWNGIVTKSRDFYLQSRLGTEGASNEYVKNGVLEFYKQHFNDDLDSFTQQSSDLNFLIPALDYLRVTSKRKTCKAYFMQFDHFPGFLKGHYKGILHGIEVLYWFDIGLKEFESIFKLGVEGEKMDNTDEEVKRLFSSVIGEFTRTGPHYTPKVVSWPASYPAVLNTELENFGSGRKGKQVTSPLCPYLEWYKDKSVTFLGIALVFGHNNIYFCLGGKPLSYKTTEQILPQEAIVLGIDPGLALKHIMPSGWPRYDVDKSPYLNFNLSPKVSSFLEKAKQDFWFETVPKLLKKQPVHSEL